MRKKIYTELNLSLISNGPLFSCVLISLFLSGCFVKLPAKFGALPDGGRMKKVHQSPHYREGRFHNLIEKPVYSNGYNLRKIIWERFAKKHPNTTPEDILPSMKTDLKSISPDSNVLVWFGHSSFFMQVDGVKFLVDPIFSGNASPFSGSIESFAGTDVYGPNDFPEIDYLLLSHDHYDHLDHKTAKALRSKVKFVVCGLGSGAHFERWGYTPNQILEKDWGESVSVKDNFKIFVESSHHFSGRALKRDQSLWVSFYVDAPSLNIYYSGDGGYSDRFKSIAAKYPPLDWAIMECGQYNKAWQSVHELPEEVAKATRELGAKNLFPVHNSKFKLGFHPWYEPLEEITKYSQTEKYRLITPMIGEEVLLDDNQQRFTQWWKGLR